MGAQIFLSRAISAQQPAEPQIPLVTRDDKTLKCNNLPHPRQAWQNIIKKLRKKLESQVVRTFVHGNLKRLWAMIIIIINF